MLAAREANEAGGSTGKAILPHKQKQTTALSIRATKGKRAKDQAKMIASIKLVKNQGKV